MTLLRDRYRDVPLRVLVVTNMYPWSGNRTYGMFVKEQVDELRRHEGVALADVLFINGVTSTLNYLRALGRIRRLVAGQNYDLIHAHYGLAVAAAVTQSRVPVVGTFHGGDLGYLAWHRWVSRIAGIKTAKNICVSQAGVAKLWSPATVLSCGIDTDAFRPRDRVLARKQFEVPEGYLALLFPGPPSRAVKRYPRYRQVCAELSDRGHKVHELHLDGVERADVPALMAAADVLVLTSASEGAPVAVMEALAAGLPIVATAVGEIPKMLSGVSSSYVGPFDVAGFAGAVESLAGTEERTPSPRARDFEQAEIVRRLVEIYEEVVHDRADRR